MTTVELPPEAREAPPERLDVIPALTTRTDEYDNRERVLPIVSTLLRRARRSAMAEGYRRMGDSDREWAEQDLPATIEVLPPE